MASTSLDGLDNRRRGYIFRGVMAGIVVLLMIISVVVPHLVVVAATEFAGRSLIPASRFFLLAQAGAEGFAGGVSIPAVAFAINVSYFGLALQQIGLLTGVASVWVLVREDVGRWMRRLVMVVGRDAGAGCLDHGDGLPATQQRGDSGPARDRLAADAGGRRS